MSISSSFKDIIKALGLVFGDIGTSPLYTLPAVFLLSPPTRDNVLGICSLVVWTLIILVLLEYTILAMSLSKKGEGGTIVLKEILTPLLKNNKQITFVTFLAYIGISLLFGDGVITPAVTILGAMEGIRVIPLFSNISTQIIIFLSVIIVLLLFAFQKKGTDLVAIAFGPIMLLWFLSLFVSGLYEVAQSPFIFKALNPYFAVKFITSQGFTAFLLLSEIILCATGGEALYADMGHLGAKPIKQASYFVLITLVFSYLGQGCFIFKHPSSQHILHEMINNQINFLYIPFFILGTIAAIIASQAMISGLFSTVYQAITTKILPTFKVDYTSSKLQSQVYLSSINWFLCFAVIFVIFYFKASHKLTAAYGLAVSGTMSITGILMTSIFYLRSSYFKAIIAYFITCLNLLFLFSNMFKIPTGGYISVFFAFIALFLILIYTTGQKNLARKSRHVLLQDFMEKYNKAYPYIHKIKGSAIFCIKNINLISPYVIQTMFKNSILYQENIFLTVITKEEPFGVKAEFKQDLAPGLRIFQIEMGYMDIIDIEKILNTENINPRVIFYGVEDIMTPNIIWKIFGVIKKITPNFVHFYKLPDRKLHGVIMPVKM